MINNTKAISFWNFLKENTIEIPIIQRDYAQGRLGKENLRKNFLKDLKNALGGGETMKLDFVYGSMENGNLNPLDGQQRLTTLWLLHWYVALRAGELSEDNCKIFRKFTYETRISSREFCQNLCVPEYFQNFDGKDIVGFIAKQTWFYSAWKQDPTVQSMLRMLGGAKIADKKGEDIIDGIEELFQETDEDGFKSYWEKLTQKEVIVFYHLPLKDFGLSDDLYIKMNARGKQLTSFENFKADLIGYITKRAEDESLEESVRVEWKKLLDPKSGIPIMLDTEWTDIFWKNKSYDNRMDEIYFAFLNRFFWNELFVAKKSNNQGFILDIGKGDENSTQENNNSSYKYLNNSEHNNDITIAYEGLDVYKYDNGTIPLSFFKKLLEDLNRYHKYSEKNTLPECPWEASFRFIPQYEVDNSNNNIEIENNAQNKILRVSTLNQVQRVVFFAVCKYFSHSGDSDDNEISLKQWMRVVWNLASGEDQNGRYQIRSTQAMRTAIEFIEKLDSHNVYASLSDYDIQALGDSDFDKRCKEEIAKAKQILDENGTLRKYNGYCEKADGSNYQTWEEIIIDAESYAFFKGAIRFLFIDGEGYINWCDFDKKWTNVKKYFDKDGEIVEEYKTNAILLRALLSRINIGENWFGYYREFWYTSLLKNDYQSAIHYLLTTLQLDIDNTCPHDWITHDSLLQKLLCCYNSWHILTNWNNYDVLTRYSQRRSDATSHNEIVVLNDLRNRLLAHKDIVISQVKKVEGTTYLYGLNINFSYNNHFFQWYGSSNDIELDIYLMENDWADYKKRPNPTFDKNTDEDKYYCFKVDAAATPDSFIKELDSLIKQAESDLS